jgi:hypothetical protein
MLPPASTLSSMIFRGDRPVALTESGLFIEGVLYVVTDLSGERLRG